MQKLTTLPMTVEAKTVLLYFIVFLRKRHVGMAKTTENVKILVTECIRKENLNASELPSFPAQRPGTEKEHFVQLNVVIRSHYDHYASKSFQAGVNALMAMRDHFNRPNNIFCVPPELNKTKRLMTEAYLKGHSKLPKMPDSLRLYIKEAAPVALKHIANLSEVAQEVRDSLTAYVNWLAQLK